jgi:hypothetical protein
MRIKDNFELRDICGEKVLIAEGVENIDFNQIVSFNETSAFVWEKAFGRDFTCEYLAKQLCDNYEVDYNQSLQDVKALIAQWQKAGMLTSDQSNEE